MSVTISAMEARQRFGEILTRVNLVHDQFIIERNGKPLAAIVPIDSLKELKNKSRKRVLNFMEASGTKLSDKEANRIAVEEVRKVRVEKRKKKSK